MRKRNFIVAAFGSVSLMSAAWGANAQPQPAAPVLSAPEPLNIWILDIGQGSCVYVECPDRRASMLIDCGSSKGSPRTPSADVVEWLNDKTASVDEFSIVISHGDEDHFSLLEGLGPAKVDRIAMGGIKADYEGSSSRLKALSTWMSTVDNAGGTLTWYEPNAFREDDATFGCKPARIDILTASAAQAFPKAGIKSRKNADSAIVMISYDGAAVVMTGDAERVTQEAALANATENGLSLEGYTIMMGSHHGARTAGSNNDEWVDVWKPEVTAFSASVEKSFRHPQCEIVGRYAVYAEPVPKKFGVKCGVGNSDILQRDVSTRILATFQNGHILIRIDGGQASISCQVTTPACPTKLPTSAHP